MILLANSISIEIIASRSKINYMAFAMSSTNFDSVGFEPITIRLVAQPYCRL